MKRKLALLALPVLALAAIALAARANPAGAATTPQLSVTLAHAKDGSAVWNAAGNPVLNPGATGAAYVDVNGESGTTAPGTSPSFTTSDQEAGNPRWVIEFHNGDYMIGYGSGGSATVNTWQCNQGSGFGAATSYPTALSQCQPGFDDQVTAAFIVMDSGNPNTTVTLSGIQYGGATADARVSGDVVVKNRLSGKCLNEDQHTGLLSQFTCLPGTYVSLHWQEAIFADGSRYLKSVQTHGFVRDGAQGQQLSLTATPTPMTFANGGIFRFPNNGLVMDDKARSRVNFAPAIGFTYNGGDNQRWDFTSAA